MYRSIVVVLLISLLNLAQAQTSMKGDFVVKPYLQIGRNAASPAMELLWHTPEANDTWEVQVKAEKGSKWQKLNAPAFNPVNVKNIAAHRVYHVPFPVMHSGEKFTYKVLKNKKEIFSAAAQSPKNASTPYRFVAFGDCGAGSVEQKPIAHRAYLEKPDFLVITGDIVYERGLISEYTKNYWPVYNADVASDSGAPLMRSIPFFSAAGNHDIDTRDLNTYPDALAYYMYWNQPLNGPKGKEGGPWVPMLIGNDTNKTAFLKAAGESYPVMSNYSFNYNNAHWTIVDSNPYVDWTNKELLDWLKNDLISAKDATWKFVVFHHPGFNSAREHYEQQHMRLISPIMEEQGVDVVFNGHVHNYQRSYPMKFVPDKVGTLLVGGREGKTIRGRVVNGQWKLDKSYNGTTDSTPEGIIYVVTGAGGKTLYNPEQNNDADSWQKFTDKFVSNTHSLTVADVDGKTLTIKQVNKDGEVLDSFKITK